MDLGLLYSGGKDSTLAALLLDGFYDVTVLTGHFGVTTDWEYARATAERLGFPFQRVELDGAFAEDVVEQIYTDGFPRNGIQRTHLHALEKAAGLEFSAIADGTRRDDRVPSVSRAQAQSLEDRYGVDYIAPLSGFGRGAIDRIVTETMEVTVGPSESIERADYEAELRSLLAGTHGEDAVTEVFPPHEQTAVVDVR